jgi:hypothetical protein
MLQEFLFCETLQLTEKETDVFNVVDHLLSSVINAWGLLISSY